MATPPPSAPPPAPAPPIGPAEDPLAAGPLLRGGYALLRAHPVALLLPLLLVGLVFSAGTSAVGPSEPAFDESLPAEDLLPVLMAFLAVVLVFAIVAFLVYLLVQGAAWLVTVRAALTALETGGAPSFGAAASAITPRLLPGLLTILVFGLAVLVGLVLLIVPGVILLAGLFPLVPVIVAEGRSGTDALTRAWALTRGRKGALFLVLLAGIGVSILGSVLLGWIPGVGGALQGAVNGAVGAWWATTAAVFYHRLRGAAAGAPVPASEPSTA